LVDASTPMQRRGRAGNTFRIFVHAPQQMGAVLE